MRRICNGIAGARKIFLAAVLVNVWIFGAAVGQGGLVAEYHFDGDVMDSSGNSNHGTLMNGGGFDTGVSGQALSLDGIDDFVDVLNSGSLKINDSVSISLWFKTEKMGNQAIIHKSSSHDFDNYWIRFSPLNKDIYWDYGGSIHYADINPIEIQTDEWYHVLVTASTEEKGRIYINGQEASKYAHQLDPPGKLQVDNNPMEIGKDFNGNYFQGLIDEVRIYNRVLTPEEAEYEYDSPGGSGGGNGGPINESCNNGIDDDSDGLTDWEDEECIDLAKNTLLENLNENNHFYEEYYGYDDNALGTDIEKTDVNQTDTNDIWIKCGAEMCYYPMKATLIGPQIGFDSNVWYEKDNPAGISSLELEIDATDTWLKEIPVAGTEIQGMINNLLGAAGEWSVAWDGVYYQAPIEWIPGDSKSVIPYKSSVQAIGPTFKNGAGAGTSGRYNYLAPTDTFQEELPSEIFLDMGIGIPADLKGMGYNRALNNSLGVLSYNLTVEFTGNLNPTLNAGDKIRFGEPRANLVAGKSLIDLELNARLLGEMCIMDECRNVNASLPLPDIQPVKILGENVLPFNDFPDGEFIESIYQNPNGNNVRYSDLDSFSPVIRLAASPVVVDYSLCFNITEFGVSCGGFLEPPCRVCPFQGNLINTEPWQDYWSFTKVSVHSPVQVNVFDENGNRAGLNSANETETEIPYSQVNISSEGEKIILFPTTAEKFSILLNGTDTGTYTLEISRPIMVRDSSGKDIIMGIKYTKSQDIEEKMLDFFSFDFEAIEGYVNEQVRLGRDIDEAAEDSLISVDYRHGLTRMPSAVYVQDSIGFFGETKILKARLMSLDRHLAGRDIFFEVDGVNMGSAITNSTGWALIPYSIAGEPGDHRITAIFAGDPETEGSEGKAVLRILNSPPFVELKVPDHISNDTLVMGIFEDDLGCEPNLNIDGVGVGLTLPFFWNISEYADGIHTMELSCIDTSGETAREMKLVMISRPQGNCGDECPDDEIPMPEFPLPAIPLLMSLGGYLLLKGNKKGG